MLVTKTAKPQTLSVDADFRQFVLAVREGFTDLGWLRTSDTGQIDATTAVAPTGTNQVVGYDILRMADTLQATAPCFVKIEYGSSSNSKDSLWVTVGTGTNGAGTLTGNVSTRQQLQVIASSGADLTRLMSCTFAGGPNRIAAWLFDDPVVTGISVMFAIERSHADDGSDTAERIDLMTATNNNFVQQVPQSGPVPASQTIWPVLAPATGSGQKGTDVGVYPAFPNQAGPLRNPLIGALVFIAGDLTSGVDYQITLYGTARTYRAHSTQISGSTFSRCSNASTAPLVLVS